MILVSGSLAYDRIMDFPGYFKDNLLPEKLHALSISFIVDTLSETPGGTASNIAYTLALLGEKSYILASAGFDFGRQIERLRGLGIDTEGIEIAPDLRTASATIVTDKADNQIAAFYPGALGRRLTDGEIPPGTALTIVAAGNPVDMKKVAKLCRTARVPYFYDPGQQLSNISKEDILDGLIGAEVFLCNDYELEILLQTLSWSEEELLQHVPVVVVTLGEKGSRIMTAGVRYEVEGVPAREVVDPTGAGDAYRAGFAKGFLAKLSLQQTGQLASAVASYAVEQRGTQEHHFTMQELAKRYQDFYKEALPL